MCQAWVVRLLFVPTALLAGIRSVPAQEPPYRLVRDLDPRVLTADAAPKHATRLGAWLYFSADDGVHGRELFRLAPGATRADLFADVLPGPTGSEVSELQGIGNQLFFLALDAQGSWRAWVTSGIPGTLRMLDQIPYQSATTLDAITWSVGGRYIVASGSNPRQFVAFDAAGQSSGLLFELAASGSGWNTYGIVFRDSAGTERLAAVRREFRYNDPLLLVVTDGTPAGTLPALTLGGQELHPVHVEGGGDGLFLVERTFTELRLWRTDGTRSGTQLLRSAPQINGEDRLRHRGYHVGGRTWIVADGPRIAWVTDGTPGGTSEVDRSGAPTALSGSWPREFLGELDGWLWAADRRQAWRIDPSTTRVEFVADMPASFARAVFYQALPSKRVRTAIRHGDGIVYRERTARELERLVGLDLRSGQERTLLAPAPSLGVDTEPPVALFAELIMPWADGSGGAGLIATDATPAGTRTIEPVNQTVVQPRDSNPRSFVSIGERVALVADGAGGQYVWLTDGLEHGTTRLSGPHEEIRALRVAGDRLFWAVRDGESWSQYRWTSGLGAPPETFAGFEPSDEDNGVGPVTVGRELMDVQGADVHRTNGLAWTTFTLSMSMRWSYVVGVAGDRLVLAGDGGYLVLTDGSPAGTTVVTHFRDTFFSESVLDSRVLFVARAGRDQAWHVVDASGAPPRLLLRTPAMYRVNWSGVSGGRMFALDGVSSTEARVTVSDGTPAGTRRELVIRGTDLGRRDRRGKTLTSAGLLYWHGSVLLNGGWQPTGYWVTDGTFAGTRRLVGLHRSPGGDFLSLPDLGGRALLTGWGGSLQTWISDGTAAGTRLLTTGPLAERLLARRWVGDDFADAVSSGGRLFISDRDAHTGLELFVLEGSRAVETIGNPCRRGQPFGTLRGSLGTEIARVVAFEGFAPHSSTAVLLMSTPPSWPTLLTPQAECALAVSPLTVFTLAAVSVQAGHYSWSVPFPDMPSLYGLRVVVQAFFNADAVAVGTDVSNGVRVTFGW